MEKVRDFFLGSLRLLALVAMVGLVACKKKKKSEDPPTAGGDYPPSDGTVQAKVNDQLLRFTYAQTGTFLQYGTWKFSGYYETETVRRVLVIDALPLPSGSDTSYTLRRPPAVDPSVTYSDYSSAGNSVYSLMGSGSTEGIYFRISVNIRGNQAEGTFEGNLFKASGPGSDTVYVREGTFSVRLQR
ncbi:MAG: hypothetical protein NZ958_06510 [Bacteroidia bacterium]|nr:hypothetical protein [Bacteroidia bacterium]MDW8089730.1 hypothetical protein [Bacteroidia bacterium]